MNSTIGYDGSFSALIHSALHSGTIGYIRPLLHPHCYSCTLTLPHSNLQTHFSFYLFAFLFQIRYQMMKLGLGLLISSAGFLNLISWDLALTSLNLSQLPGKNAIEDTREISQPLFPHKRCKFGNPIRIDSFGPWVDILCSKCYQCCIVSGYNPTDMYNIENKLDSKKYNTLLFMRGSQALQKWKILTILPTLDLYHRPRLPSKANCAQNLGRWNVMVICSNGS